MAGEPHVPPVEERQRQVARGDEAQGAGATSFSRDWRPRAWHRRTLVGTECAQAAGCAWHEPNIRRCKVALSSISDGGALDLRGQMGGSHGNPDYVDNHR
jgi:hypothetical protein